MRQNNWITFLILHSNMSIIVQKTAEKKKRIPLNLKEKLELCQYKEENPDTSFENIGKLYSEKRPEVSD